MAIDIAYLPVELHAHILRLLFLSLHKPSLDPDCVTGPLRGIHPSRKYRLEDFPYRVWEEHDVRSKTLFPFNVAKTCDLWRDLVGQRADYWPRLVFDISEDKGTMTLLSAFNLFKEKLVDGQLEVLVYSSHDLEKTKENRQVGAIVKALQAYVPKCKSITLDLTYASSIPPSYLLFLQDAPRLNKVQFDCRVNDVKAKDAQYQLARTIEQRTIHLGNSFTGLKELYLSGRAFMDLVQFVPTAEWFASLNPVGVRVSHFKFPQDGPYSLLNFVLHISKLSMTSMQFCDLSLDYEYAGKSYILPAGYSPPHIIASHIYFKSVSQGFLENLYAISDVTPGWAIYFEDCAIPANVRCDAGQLLSLTNIGGADGLCPSLCHILKAWGGPNVIFRNCPGFNNDLLTWMAKEIEYDILDDLFYPLDGPDVAVIDHEVRAGERFTYSSGPLKGLPASEMTSLTIEDCNNFSSAAIRSALQAREEIALRPTTNPEEGQAAQAAANANANPVQVGSDQAVVTLLRVQGQQTLSEEDKEWFRAKEDQLHVLWTTTIGDFPGTSHFEKFMVGQWI